MSTRNGFICATMEPFEAKFNGVEIVAEQKVYTYHSATLQQQGKTENSLRGTEEENLRKCMTGNIF